MARVRVGTIVRTHGFRGSVVVKTDSGKDSVLATVKTVYFSEKGEKPYSIKEAAWMPSGWKISLKEITSDAEAKALQGTELFAQREDLPALEKGEYYLADLEGCLAFDEKQNRVVGKFIGIEGKNGNDLWRFELEQGEVLISPTRHFISKVDTEKKRIFLTNLEELKQIP